jgi:hypothetical protein
VDPVSRTASAADAGAVALSAGKSCLHLAMASIMPRVDDSKALPVQLRPQASSSPLTTSSSFHLHLRGVDVGSDDFSESYGSESVETAGSGEVLNGNVNDAQDIEEFGGVTFLVASFDALVSSQVFGAARQADIARDDVTVQYETVELGSSGQSSQSLAQTLADLCKWRSAP